MLQTESYNLVPSGKIKGGSASYTVDLETGQVQYQASVKAGFLFITKTFPFSGNYSVPLSDLLSSNLSQMGNSVSVGGLTFKVVDVNQGLKQAKVDASAQGMAGEGLLDISGEYVKLISLNAQGTVSGFSVTLQLVRV